MNSEFGILGQFSTGEPSFQGQPSMSSPNTLETLSCALEGMQGGAHWMTGQGEAYWKGGVDMKGATDSLKV